MSDIVVGTLFYQAAAFLLLAPVILVYSGPAGNNQKSAPQNRSQIQIVPHHSNAPRQRPSPEHTKGKRLPESPHDKIERKGHSEHLHRKGRHKGQKSPGWFSIGPSVKRYK